MWSFTAGEKHPNLSKSGFAREREPTSFIYRNRYIKMVGCILESDRSERERLAYPVTEDEKFHNLLSASCRPGKTQG